MFDLGTPGALVSVGETRPDIVLVTVKPDLAVITIGTDSVGEHIKIRVVDGQLTVERKTTQV